MAEFSEVIKEYKRMCDATLCKDCSLKKVNGEHNSYADCHNLMQAKPEVFEKVVLEWSKEHPPKTNRDRFREVFGLELDNDICAEIKHNCTGVCHTCKFEGFWDRPYEGKEY